MNGASALRALVIDDDATALLVVSAVLRGLGCEVATQESSLGTTARVVREAPAPVVVDLDMPGLSGSELIRVLQAAGARARREPPACIVYSGAELPELQRVVSQRGLLGYVQKTSDVAALRRDFAELLKRLPR